MTADARPQTRAPGPPLRLGRQIEVHVPRPAGDPPLRHALFDFDGTLSLLRAGWQEVMLAQFVEVLQEAGSAEEGGELARVCREFVTRLTGRQTIYQMLQLEEEVAKRGGRPEPALQYKREYLRRLGLQIAHRLDFLRTGARPREDFLVAGSVRLLEGLRRAGVTCYLASGTDQEFVLEEAALLDLTAYFAGPQGPRIYGAVDDYRSFSKEKVIARILADNGLRGPELVAFGDGYVEIENARRAGGRTVGVASLESGGPGWDTWKRDRLLQVGAEVLVPDWQEAELLLAHLGVEAG
ncbi:MAG: HAD family hydrolase [Gemmatimonadota bacterium]